LDCKKRKDGKSLVFVSVSLNGNRVRFSTGFFAKPSKFQKDTEAKKFCKAVESRLYDIYGDFIRRGKPVDAETIADVFRTGRIAPVQTLEKCYNEFLEYLKGRNIKTEGTKVKYQRVGQMLYDALGKDKDVSEINAIDIEKMFNELSKKQMPATVADKFQRIRSFFIFLQNNGTINKNPAGNLRLNKKNREVDPLTETEILQIARKEIKNERLARVRDLAVIQAGVGMSFCDLMQLEPSDFLCEQGTYYVQKKRNKTGVEFVSVVLPFAADILKRLDFNVPKISNQKFNGYLEEIGVICEIEKHLHSHLFRHSYACLLLNKGVRMETVSKAMGHTTTKITASVYAKMRKQTVVKEISSIFSVPDKKENV